MAPYQHDVLDPLAVVAERARDAFTALAPWLHSRAGVILRQFTQLRASVDMLYSLLLVAASLTSPANGVHVVPGVESTSPIFDAFMSFSIEFVFWPDFAGNKSHPNRFSDNLLENLGQLQGVRPYVRVGGNTQDYALYDESLPYAVNGTYDLKRSKDYPTTIDIGPSFFESYSTFNNTKFTHGFNLGIGGIKPEGRAALLATVPLACKAIGKANLDMWEYGNEPDLFSISAQGPVRPLTWNAEEYVKEWLNGTRDIRGALEKSCPDMLEGDLYGYVAPSNGGVYNPLQAGEQWSEGLNRDGNVKLFSTHNYISGAESPGVTLQDTLMNHHKTTQSVDAHVRTYRDLTAHHDDVPPHILGEHNSLYHQGKPGLSNSFGAALWGIDFNLYAASVGIKRVHMHMGTDYRYGSWQPITTSTTVAGTKPPYYGNVAVAAMLSPGRAVPPPRISVAHISLPTPRAAAYAAYHNSTLARLLVLNLEAHNSTVNGTGEIPDPTAPARPLFRYAFAVPGLHGSARVQRLFANGSDAISGITWDGWSYNQELADGRPVRLRNVTVGERVEVREGVVEVEVPASQAVLVSFGEAGEE